MGVPQGDFENIIRKVAEETPGCTGVEINGPKVRMHWADNDGLHHLEQYNFDNNGEITGSFVLAQSTSSFPGSAAADAFERESCEAIRRFIKQNGNAG